MTNFTQLQDGLILYLGNGVDAADVRVKNRYIREQGLTQKASRIKGFPQTEAVHATVALITALAGGNQVGIVDRVRSLFHLPFHPYRVSRPAFGDRIRGSLSNLRPSGIEINLSWLGGSFGEVITNLIDYVAKSVEEGDFDPQNFQTVYTELTLSQNGRFAVISGGVSENSHPDLWFCTPRLMFNGGAVSITTVPSFALIRLGHMVAESRKEAKKRGIQIPVEETYRALRVNIDPSPSPTTNPEEGEALAGADPNSGDETEKTNADPDCSPSGVRFEQPTTSTPTVGAWQHPMVSEQGRENQPPLPSSSVEPASTIIGKGARRDDAREGSAHRIAA